MSVVRAVLRCGGEQAFGENDSSAIVRSVRLMAAPSNSIKPVTGSNHPRIGDRAIQISSKILENGWMLRSDCSEVVKRLVRPCRDAGVRDVMAENSSIYDLSKKRCAWNEFVEKLRNVFLAFR